MTATTISRPPVKLIGQDGNAFNIMGLCMRAAKKAGWSDEQWQVVLTKMMSGDYSNLLAVAMEYFNVR